MRRFLIIFSIGTVGIALVALVFFLSSLGGDTTQEGERRNIFDAIFPFGRSDNEGGGASLPGGNDRDPIETPVPRLRQVSERPTAGGHPFEEDDRFAIRYMDRETGHIYETFTDTSTVRRVSNTTIPGVLEMLWVDKSSGIIRSFENNEVENFSFRLTGSASSTQTTAGVFTGTWVWGSLSPDKESLLTLWYEDDGSVLRASNPQNENESVVFRSPLRLWIPKRTDGGNYVQTAPASGISGFLYRISNSSLIPTVSDVPGLLTLPSPDGSYVLISSGGQNFASLSLIDTVSQERTQLPFSGLAYKCVWTSDSEFVVCGVPKTLPAGDYPNAWLEGRVSFTDSLWLINVETSETTELSNIEEEYNVALDVWQPALDETGSVLTFINKKDLSFWSFEVVPPVEETEEN